MHYRCAERVRKNAVMFVSIVDQFKCWKIGWSSLPLITRRHEVKRHKGQVMSPVGANYCSDPGKRRRNTGTYRWPPVRRTETKDTTGTVVETSVARPKVSYTYVHKTSRQIPAVNFLSDIGKGASKPAEKGISHGGKTEVGLQADQ